MVTSKAGIAGGHGPGLRELHKSRRRGRILDAAREMIRSSPIDQVSIEQIAEVADVAAATVYNLLGPRAAIWAALIDDLLDKLDERLSQLAGDDPVAMARAVITESVQLFVADADVHRQALLHLRAEPEGGRALRHNPVELQIEAMRGAIEVGILERTLTPEQLGRQIFASYNGALYFWAARGLPEHEFERLALHGLYTVLAAAATDATRAGFISELRTLGAA